MAQKTYRVTIQNETRLVAEHTRFAALVSEYESVGEPEVLLVRANGVLRELRKEVTEDCQVELLTAASIEGRDTYKRSLNLLLLKAVDDVLGGGQQHPVILHFSNGNGYYYTVEEKKPVTPEFAQQVKTRMEELVAARIPIEKELINTASARQLFESVGMEDKARLFKYRRVSNLNLYHLENFRDYFYGYMAPDTGYLKWFDVTAYADGLVLVLPDQNDMKYVRPYAPFPKIFHVQQESERWADRVGINAVPDLNDYITSSDIGHAQLVAEALQESEISEIAKQIQQRENVKFVMIAGPSSSGKTTFSRRLSIQLTAQGLTPHPISLDNFYHDRQLCPRDEDGNYDYECLEAIDVPLIREIFAKLLGGERVELPRFNFLTGQREYRGDFLELGEKDILVVEGIHGLNRKLCEGLPESHIYRVYISAITQLNVDAHNPISTTDGRLIRRIVRDYRTRGTNARETIAMWPSVRRGENRYIFPNQENADYIFNSALIYELSVLKVYAEPLLFQVPEDAPEYAEAKRLLKFLDYFLGIPSEQVPNNSILREFIGGSCFDV